MHAMIPCIALALVASALPASAQSTTGFGQTEASLDYARGARIVCGRGGCREAAPLAPEPDWRRPPPRRAR